MTYEQQLYYAHVERMKRLFPSRPPTFLRKPKPPMVVEEVAKPENVAPIVPEPPRPEPPRPAPPPPFAKYAAVRRIIETVAVKYGVSVDQILSADRKAHIVRPRHIAMYLVKNAMALSFPDTGRRFGGRDHTTVLHAVRRVASWRLNPKIDAELSELETAIGRAES